MTKVMPGRYTAQIDEPFVVFLIGMRINKWLAFSKWIPTARAMVPMLRTLFQHPEKGFLGGQIFFYWRGIGVPLKSSKRLPEIGKSHIWLPGSAITKLLARMAVWASGTRPTSSRQDSTRWSTAICQSSAWLRPPGRCQPLGVVRRPAVVWAVRMNLRWLHRPPRVLLSNGEVEAFFPRQVVAQISGRFVQPRS